MDDGGRGTSKGLAPSHAEGIDGMLTLLTSALQPCKYQIPKTPMTHGIRLHANLETFSKLALRMTPGFVLYI